MERIMSIQCSCWNLFVAPVRKNAHSFCKQDIYQLHQPENGKKLGKSLVAPWGWLFGNYWVSSSMFFYHIVSGMFFYHIVLNGEKKCAKKHLRLFRLSDFSIYYLKMKMKTKNRSHWQEIKIDTGIDTNVFNLLTI